MANMHMKRRSMSLAVRKMKIKTTFRCHFTPTRVAIIENTDKNKCLQGSGEIRSLPDCCKNVKLVHSLWKKCLAVPKDETEFPYDPTIPLLGI